MKFLKFFKPLKDTDIAKAKSKTEFNEIFKNLPEGELKTKVKGARELTAIIASGVILTIITPQIVNKIIHPLMNKDKNENKLDKKI